MENMNPTMIERIEKVPRLKKFVTSVKSKLSKKYPNSFWECKDDFQNLLNSDFGSELINHELERLEINPSYAVSDANPGGFFIVKEEFFKLGIVLFEKNDKLTPHDIANKVILDNPEENKEMLYGLTSHQMLGVLHGEQIEIQRYKQKLPFPIEIFDESRKLENLENLSLVKGKINCFRAYEDAYKFVHPKVPTILLFFLTDNIGGLRWEYDSKSFKPTKLIATSMNSSRIEWALETLVQMDSIDSVKNMEKLYNHPDHFVRWASISSLIQLDFEKGYDSLLRAVDDKHPHVKNAAQKSLIMLKENNTEVESY
jgi:hypothetical protein